MHDEKIFEGVKVLDLTTFVTGGFCSLMLANQGADVVKVERPGVGDDNRHSGPPFIGDESPYFWTINYGKKSVELDLKSEAGLNALYDLVEKADVFIQNFRPGTAERIGVDDETIRSHNDEIVYCAISAYGQTGPWRERPGYDLMIQGMSGIMSITGEEGRQPVKVGLPMTDLITAMWAAFGISGALYRRQHTGEGEYIDLGMLDAALPWLSKQAGKVFAGEEPTRMGSRDPVLAPYQTFPTADGYINVAALNEKLWTAFCEAIERPELIDDERFATNSDRVDNMDELEAIVSEALGERTTDEWITRIVEEAGVPAGPVFDVEDALYNEQTEARGVMKTLEHPEHGEVPIIEHPLNFENVDSGFETPAPQLGEHNRRVFEEIGYTEEEIEALAESGGFGDE